jgi:hypothetical protein
VLGIFRGHKKCHWVTREHNFLGLTRHSNNCFAVHTLLHGLARCHAQQRFNHGFVYVGGPEAVPKTLQNNSE